MPQCDSSVPPPQSVTPSHMAASGMQVWSDVQRTCSTGQDCTWVTVVEDVVKQVPHVFWHTFAYVGVWQSLVPYTKHE